MSAQPPRFIAKQGTVLEKLLYLKGSSYFCTPNLKEYIEYFIKFPENVLNLSVIYDKRCKIICGYIFKDALTNVIHFELHPKPNRDSVKHKLAVEYGKLSGQSTKQIKEIFSNLP